MAQPSAPFAASEVSLRGPADLRRCPEARLPFRTASAEGGISLPEPVAWGNDVDALLRAAASLAPQRDPPGPVLIAYAVADLEDARLFLQDLAAQQEVREQAGEDQNGPTQGGLELLLCAPQDPDRAADLLGESGLRGQVLAAPLLSAETQKTLCARAPAVALVGLCSGPVRLDPALLLRARMQAHSCPQLMQILEEIPRQVIPSLTPFAVKTVLQQIWPDYDHRSVQGLNLFLSAAFFSQLGGLPLEGLAEGDPSDDPLALAGPVLACRGWRAGAYIAPLLVPALPRFQHVPRPEAWARRLDLCPELRTELCAELRAELRTGDGVLSCPKLSVVVAAGPGLGRTVANTVDSVLAQNWGDLEICIPPDHITTQDLSPIRAGGLEQAQGAYVLALRAGDRLAPGALRQMLQVLESDPQVALCGAGRRVGAEVQRPPQSHLDLLLGQAPPVFMWRRGLLARTPEDGRADLAEPYDLALQLAETGALRALAEPLVWWERDPGDPAPRPEPTPARAAALMRLGLARDWQVTEAGAITARPDRPQLFVWPDFARANPYQHLLYRQTVQHCNILVAPIETALIHLQQALKKGRQPDIRFHLHWTSPLFHGVRSRGHARLKIRAFLRALTRFKSLGGRIFWTVHNTLSHDGPFMDLERSLSARIVALADVVHLHSEASLPEVRTAFEVPAQKVRIARHGHYLGVYGDQVSRETARALLGLEDGDQVILFLGQVRPYKGVGQLVESFRRILQDHPRARLLIGGAIHDAFWETVSPALTPHERSRILASERFLDEAELQLYLRAADLAVFPYRNILTSGALLLALSFDLPVVIPEVGMTREVLAGRGAGVLYDGADPAALDLALHNALGDLHLAAAGRAARMQSWQRLPL